MRNGLTLLLSLVILTSCATYVPDTNNAIGRCLEGGRWDSFEDAAPANNLVITKLDSFVWSYRVTNAQGCSWLFKVEDNIIVDSENISDPITCVTKQSVIDRHEECARRKGN